MGLGVCDTRCFLRRPLRAVTAIIAVGIFEILNLGQNMPCKVERDGGLGVGRAFLQASRVSGVAGSFMGPAPVAEML